MLLNRSEMDDAMHLVNGARADLLHAQDFEPRSKGWNRWGDEALKKLLEAAELMAGHNQAPTEPAPDPWDLSLYRFTMRSADPHHILGKVGNAKVTWSVHEGRSEDGCVNFTGNCNSGDMW